MSGLFDPAGLFGRQVFDPESNPWGLFDKSLSRPPYTDPNLIQFVGRKLVSIAGATSGDTTIDLSSGLEGGIGAAVQPGDMVIAAYGTGSGANRTLSITDGTTAYDLFGTEQYNDMFAGFDTNFRVGSKFMGAIPDASVVFGPTGSVQDAGNALVYVLRGVDPADIGFNYGSGTNNTNPDGYSINVDRPGTRLVRIAAGAAGTATPYNTPADMKHFATAVSAGSNDAVIGVGISAAGWAGSNLLSTGAWTGGSSGTDRSNIDINITLRPRLVAEITSGGTWSHNGIYSGLYGGVAGTGMRNGSNNGNDVYGSDAASGEFLKWDLGERRKIIGARIACVDADPGIWGGPWGAVYTNNALLQWSDDNSAWTTELTLTGYVDDTDEFLNWDISTASAHRYWRIYKATGFVAVGEFRLWALPRPFYIGANWTPFYKGVKTDTQIYSGPRVLR
jgi:hypothetical protein